MDDVSGPHQPFLQARAWRNAYPYTTYCVPARAARVDPDALPCVVSSAALRAKGERVGGAPSGGTQPRCPPVGVPGRESVRARERVQPAQRRVGYARMAICIPACGLMPITSLRVGPLSQCNLCVLCFFVSSITCPSGNSPRAHLSIFIPVCARPLVDMHSRLRAPACRYAFPYAVGRISECAQSRSWSQRKSTRRLRSWNGACTLAGSVSPSRSHATTCASMCPPRL